MRGPAPRLRHRFLIALLAVVGCGSLGVGSATGWASVETAPPLTGTEQLAATPLINSAPAAASATPALASFSARAAPGDEQVVLSWIYATTTPRASALHVDLYQVVGGETAKWGSTVIGRTVEPNRYAIPVFPGTWIVKATPRSDAGFGPEVSSGAIRVGRPCAAATLCARVASSSDAARPVRLTAQGFLHGVDDGAGIHRTAMQQLRPRQWRYAGASADASARSLRVKRTQVLSDLWYHATRTTNLGYAKTPWSNWGAWDSFVTATVQAALRDGWAPDAWDVWNEPNGTCCPKFRPDQVPTISVDRWLETYVSAWKAIKAVDPSARVIGPSLSALQWAPGSPAEFDLDTFLAHSAAQGVTWDAVSWHENTAAPSPGDIASSVTNVDRHIAMARAVMARHPGTVAGNRIVVNEYGPADRHVLPGWAVGYFRTFEDGGVSEANMACWSAAECGPQLGGLFTSSRRTTALWWAHRLYANLRVGTRMDVASSSSWQLSGLATRTDSSRTVRALLGRHWSCNRAVNPWCSSNAGIAPASLAVTIAWPYGTGRVRVESSRLPAGVGAVAKPSSLGIAFVRPSNGTLTVRVPSLRDGDAVSILARPTR